MDPISALIGGAFGLFGASKQQKQEEALNERNIAAQERANFLNRPSNQVAEWRKAGINPLVGVTQGAFTPHQAATSSISSNAIGDAYLNAGSLFSAGLDRQNALVIEKTRQQEISARQEKEIRSLRRASQPTNMQKHGGAINEISQVLSGGVRNTLSTGSRGSGNFLEIDDEKVKFNKKEVPTFRAIGQTFKGSGAFTTGETFEDAVGEGPLSWINSIGVVADAFHNTLATSDRYTEHMKRRDAAFRRIFTPTSPPVISGYSSYSKDDFLREAHPNFSR